MSNWTEEHRINALKEGWDVFELEDGRLVIQSLGDPEGVEEAFGIKVRMRFRCDLQARSHVYSMAANGSHLHEQAVLLLESRADEIARKALGSKGNTEWIVCLEVKLSTFVHYGITGNEVPTKANIAELLEDQFSEGGVIDFIDSFREIERQLA